jgi:endonuclease YncB( thermonuclease family)
MQHELRATITTRALRWLIWPTWSVLLVLTLPAQAQLSTSSATWLGVVTYVVDGDTVHVRPLVGGDVHKIRVVGIDAPEICQIGGKAARQALRNRVLKRSVTVSLQGVDDYGRDLAMIYLSQEDVGRWMVQRGHAWSYRYRHDLGPYLQEEERAKLLGRGLFAEMSPEYPRDFRHRYGHCTYRD